MHGKTKAAVVTGGGDRDTLARYSIVAIGGSAGSLESVRTILHGLPADFSSPILVVIHLHPDYVSHAAEILGRQTSLKVKDAQQHERLQPGVVYMAPTDHHLLVGAGLVELSTAASVNFSRPAIDRTFDSVVQAYGSKVIGVVLSGSGKDGSQGLRAIKQAGGFAIVQDPREARFTAMPAAAVSASAVDCVLPMQQIAPLLLKLSRMVQG